MRFSALADRDAGRHQVERRGHRRRRGDRARGVRARAAEPVEQRAAAQRHADRVTSVRARSDARAHRGEHRADFLVIAGVIGARQAIRLAAAAAKVRNDAAPARAPRASPSAPARNASRSCLRGHGTARPPARRRRVGAHRPASRNPRNRRPASRRVRAGSATGRAAAASTARSSARDRRAATPELR